MKFPNLLLAVACLMSSTLLAQEAKVTELMSKDLTNLPGKESLMIVVDYPPGSSDAIHRHNAHANFFWPVLYQSLTETHFLTVLTRASRVRYS